MTHLYVACKPACPDACCPECGAGKQVYELKSEIEAERTWKDEARQAAEGWRKDWAKLYGISYKEVKKKFPLPWDEPRAT